MDKKESIIVYDEHSIELSKYPRMNSNKEITDKILITFFMNQEILKNLSISYEKAIKYHHECKDYFYVFKSKKYSAKDIIQMINYINDYYQKYMSNPENLLHFFKNSDPVDIHYYFYIKNIDFYMGIFRALEDGKKLFFKRQDFSYKVVPPMDFYGKHYKNGNIYSALELMEIHAYSQYLVKRRIIKELPSPIYLQK